MTSPIILLLDGDHSRANQRAEALRSASFDVFCVSCEEEAKEALTLRHFNAVLISPASGSSTAESIRHAICMSKPPVLLLAFADADSAMPPNLCDALIPSETPDGSLAAEISLAFLKAKNGGSSISSQLADFDAGAFREQMGDDPELMSEIVGLFLEESGTQLHQLSRCLAANDFNAASRVAHSLKGSLGSIHAARARHWAEALETAAAARDRERSEQCLSSLGETIAALQPELQPLLL